MSKVTVGELADAVMESLTEYSELATDDMKKAVKLAGNFVKTEISNTAPKKTGAYAGSWRSRVTEESASDITVTVYSPSRYRLAHLLEHGHAFRNGGRARAFPHITPAEEKGMDQLDKEIKQSLDK